MSPNAAWGAWKVRLEALFNYRPHRPDELTAAVDAYMATMRAAVYETAREAAHDAIAAHEAERKAAR